MILWSVENASQDWIIQFNSCATCVHRLCTKRFPKANEAKKFPKGNEIMNAYMQKAFHVVMK